MYVTVLNQLTFILQILELEKTQKAPTHTPTLYRSSASCSRALSCLLDQEKEATTSYRRAASGSPRKYGFYLLKPLDGSMTTWMKIKSSALFYLARSVESTVSRDFTCTGKYIPWCTNLSCGSGGTWVTSSQNDSAWCKTEPHSSVLRVSPAGLHTGLIRFPEWASTILRKLQRTLGRPRGQ